MLPARTIGATEAAVEFLRRLKEEIWRAGSTRDLFARLSAAARTFYEERPTSAMLVNTIKKVGIRALRMKDLPVDEAARSLTTLLDDEVRNASRTIEEVAEVASRRIPDDSTILTHSYSTTVLKAIVKARDRGKVRRVFVTESRPGGEGVLMARELAKNGVPVTLIVDSAVNFFMDKMDLVVVGAEAITANGALVNKVGTSTIAMVAYHKRRRMLVLAGTYKFSFETVYGELIRIPEAGAEALGLPLEPLTSGVLVRAPLMDVTRPQYIDAIVTEKGVTSPAGVPLVIWEAFAGFEEVRTMSIHQVLSLLESVAR